MPSPDPNRVVGNPWRKMGLHAPGSAGAEPPPDPLGRSSGHGRTKAAMDPELEKEVWLNRVRVDWGQCGFSMMEASGKGVLATILFAPPRFAPTSRRMPSGPVSPDAVMLTSLHIDPIVADRGVEESLVTAAVTHLAGRGIKAVEAFGCSGSGSDDDAEPIPREEMTLTESILNAVDAPRMPHRCDSAALGAINHEAGDVIPTRILINSGFTVVAPHPTHPRLRRELDPELDWAAAVGDALDQLVAAQFYASLSAARSSTKL